MATSAPPVHGERLFAEMMRDIMGPAAEGAAEKGPLEAASYALGYNLAIEYLADYEKVGGVVLWGVGSFGVSGSSALSSLFLLVLFIRLSFSSQPRFQTLHPPSKPRL